MGVPLPPGVTINLYMQVPGQLSLNHLHFHCHRYYLNRFSEPAFADSVLAEYAINVTEVQEDIVKIFQNITARYNETVIVDSADRAKIASVIGNLTAAKDLLEFDLDKSNHRGLLYLLSLGYFQSQYNNLKEYLCCDIPSLAYR